MSNDSRVAGLGKGRIESLTDGIFATAMTVLVISLSVPVISTPQISTELIVDLKSLFPTVLGYVISFVVLAAYWVRHHNMFHYIARVDGGLLWLNILFLLTVGFIPFSTALIGRYPLARLPVIIYGSNLIATGLSLHVLWVYSTNRKQLIATTLNERIVARVNILMLMGPLAYAAAIIFSFINTELSLAIYTIIPVFYIFLGIRRQHLTPKPTIQRHPKK
ncbi:MAG: TMEM175 family protein [Candidatus Bathyarchaeia archaeon]|jgi:uncharacterized membrane protein